MATGRLIVLDKGKEMTDPGARGETFIIFPYEASANSRNSCSGGAAREIELSSRQFYDDQVKHGSRRK